MLAQVVAVDLQAAMLPLAGWAAPLLEASQALSAAQAATVSLVVPALALVLVLAQTVMGWWLLEALLLSAPNAVADLPHHPAQHRLARP